MKKTLYDFLGVRRDASRTEIEKAYDRMQARYAGANGMQLATRDGCSVHLIEEAFATLSSPAKREAYDASLKRAAQRELEARGAAAMIDEPTPGPRYKLLAMLAVAVLLAGGWYWKSSHDARVERERQFELRRIEAERHAAEAEAARLRAENEQSNLRQAAEDQRASRDLQRYAARYGAVRSQVEHSEQRRQDMERRQAELDKQRQEAMERQARERDMNQRQRRDAEDRRYLDQFKPGMSFSK
jgi:curved DNA-binding protein CbpA